MQESGLTAIIPLMSSCSMGAWNLCFLILNLLEGTVRVAVMWWLDILCLLIWQQQSSFTVSTDVWNHQPRAQHCAGPDGVLERRDPACVLQELAKDSTAFYPSSPACRPASTGWGLMSWEHVCPQGHPAKDVGSAKAALQKVESVDSKWEEEKHRDSVSRPGWRLPSCGPS